MNAFAMQKEAEKQRRKARSKPDITVITPSTKQSSDPISVIATIFVTGQPSRQSKWFSLKPLRRTSSFPRVLHPMCERLEKVLLVLVLLVNRSRERAPGGSGRS